MECPQVGHGSVFRQITSNWFQTCRLRTALCISCMIEVYKCFGKGFGWICALNRWSVQERAHNSFCPIACQVLHYLAWELCRQIAAWILSRLTPFSVGGQEGGWGGWGHFGPEAQNLHVTVMNYFLRLLLSSLSFLTCVPRLQIHIFGVGQNRIYTPYMTVYLMISLPKIPYIHRIYIVLANPTHFWHACSSSFPISSVTSALRL